MATTEESLLNLLKNLPVSGWGISELSGDFQICSKKLAAHHFNRAISLLQAYSYPMENYSPFAFHSFLSNKIKPALDSCAVRICLFLEQNKVPYHNVTNVREDPLELIGEYSQKRAAVLAGLGWIGKNTLLVHPQYGPRVHISTVLTDLELPVSYAAKMPGCGNCSICVNCCPSQCLKGLNWEPGIERSDLIDISLCRFRNEALRDCICGVCLLACPYGKDNDKITDKVISI